MLWRVRRKLTLSYIFIGFVPVLLIVLFFSLRGLLLFFNVSAYLLRERVNALVDARRFLAQTAAATIWRTCAAPRARAGAGAAPGRPPTRSFRCASFAVVPASARVHGGRTLRRRAVRWPAVLAARGGTCTLPAVGARLGVVRGLRQPDRGGHAADPRGRGSRRAPSRGVTHDDVREAVVVDVPLGEMLLDVIRNETGVVGADAAALLGR